MNHFATILARLKSFRSSWSPDRSMPQVLQKRPASFVILSPEVHHDHRVTFRVDAPPDSRLVKVSGEWPGGSSEMAMDEFGIWSVTIGPLEPDLYAYSFSVDGFRVADPSNPMVKPMQHPRASILDVPGKPPGVHDFDPSIAHGATRAHWYFSRLLGRRRRLHVYTPPGYEDNLENYPTLYLLHGAGDNDATWVELGRAPLILDSLQARGDARPFVVAMVDGHVTPAVGGAEAEARERNLEVFQRELINEIIPFVEENYRTGRSSDRRAIAGVSMGGGQSLAIGLNHPNLFAWVGGFSSSMVGAAFKKTFADVEALNAGLRLVWLACGEGDYLMRANCDFHALLDLNGVRHSFRVTEGNHVWPTWRLHFTDFVLALSK